MSRLGELLRQVADDLTAAGTPFALVGGLAVSARTEPRFTRDIDIAVAARSDAEAEAVVASLGASLRPVGVLEHDALGRMATARLASTRPGAAHTDPVVDLMFALSGIEAEVAAAGEAIEVLPGVVLPVARVGHLIALKVLSADDGRPLDAQDLIALLEVADAEELDRARAAVALVGERGADRGRDLPSALEAALDAAAEAARARRGRPPAG